MAEKVHTGMRINSEQLNKIKYIGWHDRRTFTSVLELAISDYIDKWEKSGGAITNKMLKDSKIV